MNNENLKTVLYHIDMWDGTPLCEVSFGSLELVLKCLFLCHDCVVIHTKPVEP